MLNKKEASVNGDGNVVIQNSDNSTITINLNNPDEVRKVLLDLQGDIKDLPLKVIQLLMKNNKEEAPQKGANVYLSLNIMFETLGNHLTERIVGVSFGVSVTNTNKEHRFFYEPIFKSSVPFEGNLDTFAMTDKHLNNPIFPKRLEYGEPFTAYYNIPNVDLFKRLLEKDATATITAVVNTTLGEVFLSNEYKLQDLLNEAKLMPKVSR